MKQKTAPSVFNYTHYRLFLRDYYDYMKQTARYFSYRYFAKRAGLSASLLKDIINGRQKLSVNVLEKYAHAMNLTQKEMDYFRALTGFNNAEVNGEKSKLFNDMVHLRGRSIIKFIEAGQYEYFSKWYYSVIRELLVINKFNADARSIAQAILPKVTQSQVKKTILSLQRIGLISKDPNRQWKLTDKAISSENQIQSMALKNYHASMIHLASEALDRFGAGEREFQTLTLSGSRELFHKIKQRIRGFRDEILSMAADEKSEAEAVFQLNLNLFPFTTLGETDEEP